MTRANELLTWVAALVFGALLTGTPAAAGGGHPETCRYFSAEAFKDRRERRETTFRMHLAQDCVDALVYIRSPDAGIRERAEAYLAQLEEYRRVLVGMLVARAHARPAGRGEAVRYVRSAVDPVSGAGAYLIARRMGLVDTHQDWTAWRQSYASADPRLRID